MAGSLRDQLVKSGLASASQARKAERQTRAEKQASRHKHAGDAEAKAGGVKRKAQADPSSPANVQQRARQLNTQKVKRDRAIASVRNARAAEKAIRAEIKQIIAQNDQRAGGTREDDAPYNFLHGKKIKKIYVPQAQREQLSSGSLVIVNDDGHYHLVSTVVAEQIGARDPKRIITVHKENPAQPSEHDDHYARFKVPDDLDW